MVGRTPRRPTPGRSSSGRGAGRRGAPAAGGAGDSGPPRARVAEAPSAASDPAACREAALRLLERTRRTRVDLARRLKDKGFAPATIEGVLGRLADVGLVDDAEYARAWLAGRRGRRPSGWRRLESELRAKGVAADDIARARAMLEEREGAVDEVAAARKAVAAAELRMAALDPRVRRGRLWGLLARRGFTPDVIREALGIPEATAPDPVE